MKTQFATFLTLLLLFSFAFSTVAQDSVRADSCPNALPSRLVNGARGRVLAGAPNRLRAEPSADAEILDEIPADSTFSVLDGPECVEAMAWWQVRYKNQVGWTAEGQGENYWVEPSLLPDLEPITAANVSRLQPLAMLGVNLITDVAWSPDGKILLAAGSAGLWRFDLNQPDMPPYLLEGYAGFFHSLAYSPDGKFVVTGSEMGAIRIWDTATWTPSAVLQASGATIEKVAFNADGQRLAAGGSDGTVQVWDFMTRVIAQTWNLQDRVTNLAFNPNPESASLVVMHYNGASVFDLATGAETELGNVWFPQSLAFSPDGSLLAIGTYEANGDGASPNIPLYLFDGKTGSLLAALWMYVGTINSLNFADNDTLFLNGRENTEVWHVKDLLAGTPAHEELRSNIGISDEDKVLVVDGDKIAPQTLPGGQFFRLNVDRKELAVVNKTAIQLIDSEMGSTYSILRLPFFDQSAQGLTSNIAFSPTQPLLAFGVDNVVQLLNTDSGIPQAVLTGHEIDVTALAFSADGKSLASGSGEFPDYGNEYGEDGGVRVWNMPDGTLKTVLHGYTQPVMLLRLSADGSILFSSYNYSNSGGNLGTWNLNTNRLIDFPYWFRFITFSPSTPTAVISSSEYIDSKTHSSAYLWDTQRNLQTRLIQDSETDVGDVFFSHDGKLVVIGSKLWSVETGKPTELNRTEYFADAIFSPDDSFLAYFDETGIILWDVATETKALHIDLDSNSGGWGNSYLFFSPDGSLLFLDNRFWDVQTGELLGRLRPLAPDYEYITAASGISTDSRLVTQHCGRVICLWGVPAGESN